MNKSLVISLLLFSNTSALNLQTVEGLMRHKKHDNYSVTRPQNIAPHHKHPEGLELAEAEQTESEGEAEISSEHSSDDEVDDKTGKRELM